MFLWAKRAPSYRTLDKLLNDTSIHVRQGVTVCVLWWLGVFQWTWSTVIHTFLSPSPHTNMVDSIELEPGITTTLMAKDLPHLTILASFLLST